ncbi:hypothetical protein EON67_00500, partial [archaeon]
MSHAPRAHTRTSASAALTHHEPRGARATRLKVQPARVPRARARSRSAQPTLRAAGVHTTLYPRRPQRAAATHSPRAARAHTSRCTPRCSPFPTLALVRACASACRAMGVPAFFRWLRDKYGKCIADVIEAGGTYVDGVEVPPDTTSPNPNGCEFDNLYIDMNGIIHPCVHPEDVPAPKTEEEMFEAICAYVDRLVYAVRPRKVLYLAIDGVAPRAKMNQQRARRFKAARDMAEEEEVENALRETMLAKGQKVPPKKSGGSFDHNVITPGTQFMDRLAKFLRFYITERIHSRAAWRDLRVILSDASVPGEGEHKIMEFVRQQRAQPGYNPNTYHCLHGLDADLIMLGLATHEAHFTILREDVLGKATNKCFVCGREGHRAAQCSGILAAQEATRAAEGKNTDSNSLQSLQQRKPLQFLHLSVLREYLELEFASLAAGLPFAYDVERVIDDFVFMCFFVGNDFLPHLPSMDIREGAIDLLLQLYRQMLPAMGGYITDMGEVNLTRADILLGRVSTIEAEIFRRRRVREERERANAERYKKPETDTRGDRASGDSTPGMKRAAPSGPLLPTPAAAGAGAAAAAPVADNAAGAEPA